MNNKNKILKKYTKNNFNDIIFKNMLLWDK